MEANAALKVLRVLRHSKGKVMTDLELRKATGLTQTELDLASEELAEEGMIEVSRRYTLTD